MNSNCLLIDADILVYRIAWGSQEDSEEVACERLHDKIREIQNEMCCDVVTCYLTSNDKSNFRFKLSSNYKANRVQEKPIHYELMRRVLIEEYNATIVSHQEADDQLGIDQTEHSCIVSIDKDLDQIQGWHYNFVKGIKYFIDKTQGLYNFYAQVLTGDTADNVQGCPKIGKVKAERLLKQCKTEKDFLEKVVVAYENEYLEGWEEKLYLAGNLLWIRRKPNQAWETLSGVVVSKENLLTFYKNLDCPFFMSLDESLTSFSVSTSQTLN